MRQPTAGVSASHSTEIGFLLGLLVGEGHFGGDGRQPQVTLRMHVRHEHLFRWIMSTFPGGRLYGPYNHGGRRYYQWMARGSYLADVIAPLVATHIDLLDDYASSRFRAMCEQYSLRPFAGSGTAGSGTAGSGTAGSGSPAAADRT